jgi:regulator of sigma E protease
MAFLTSILLFLKSAVPFIVTIFVLVTAHEFGHFIAARIFGMHVPVFSVGMGRRLFGFNKLFGFTFGPLKTEQEEKLGVNTDYRLALLPIGGYAKIDGMIDETQTEALSPVAQPWEFRAKPWWQKTIVICAGVIMNIIVAITIFTALVYRQGDTVKNTKTIGYVLPSSAAAQAGIQSGQEVVAVNGKPVANWTEIEEKVAVENAGQEFSVDVKTPQGIKTVHYSAIAMKDVSEDELAYKVDQNFGLWPIGHGHVVVDTVVDKPARDLGLKSGDRITAVNSDSVFDQYSLITLVGRHANDSASISWLRNGTPMVGRVLPDKMGHIGIQMNTEPYHGPSLHKEYSIFQAIPKGAVLAKDRLGLISHGIWLVVTGKVPAASALGGPIKIFKFAKQSASYGGSSFLIFIAMLSLSLAFLNILPVPALDGGHLVIILIEAVLHRELSQKVKLGIQKVGVVLILSLMAFMVFNDIRSL